MKNALRVIKILLLVVLFGFFHYALPQHDIARVTGTDILRQDFSGWNRIFYAQQDSGASNLSTRDVRLISTVKRKTFLFGFIPRDSERVMVYRNEDTGWIWPPYFKFDSSDLQAEAQAAAAKTNQGLAQWVVITHYGWRNRFLSIYPNAVRIREIDGPDVTIIPWFNITFFIFLIAAVLTIRGMWLQFRERRLDPVLHDIDEATDTVSDRARGFWSRLFGRR